jgi:hypothetical protein
MYFPAEKILEATKKGVSDTNHGRDILCEVFPEIRGNGNLKTMALMLLKSLPTATEQEKILAKLTSLSLKAGARIQEFKWWYITTKEHWLFARIQRDGRDLPALFLWETVEKGRKSALPTPWSGTRWAKNSSEPITWRVQFQSPEYHTVVGIYERWLISPIGLNPDEEAAQKKAADEEVSRKNASGNEP